ncbi:MAG: hypothetical protein ACYTHK_10250 [Planctomycetota bacterium]|jgi:type II secretory pathway component GspD/PulD (secretin)
MVGLLLLLAADEMTFSMENVPFEQVVKVVEVYTGWKLEFAEEYRGWGVSVVAKKQRPEKVLEVLAKQVLGRSRKLGKRRYRIAPMWQHVLYRVLEDPRTTTIKIEETDLDMALRLCRFKARYLQLHPGIDPKKKVSFSAADATQGALLDHLAKAAGAEWALRYGVIYVAPKGELARMPVRAPNIAGTVTLYVENRKLTDVLRLLEQQTRGTFTKPDKLPDVTITAKLSGIELSHALAIVLYPAGLTAKAEKGELIIEKMK